MKPKPGQTDKISTQVLTSWACVSLLVFSQHALINYFLFSHYPSPFSRVTATSSGSSDINSPGQSVLEKHFLLFTLAACTLSVYFLDWAY